MIRQRIMTIRPSPQNTHCVGMYYTEKDQINNNLNAVLPWI